MPSASVLYDVPSGSLPAQNRRMAVFYLRSRIAERVTPSVSFYRQVANPPRKTLTVHVLNLHLPTRSRKVVTVRFNQADASISEAG